MILAPHGNQLLIEGHQYAVKQNLAGFRLWVACAMEYSPYDYADLTHMTLWCPMDDTEPARPKDLDMAVQASGLVAAVLNQGQDVLCTCALGLNRSSLVAGLALKRLGWSTNAVVEAIMDERGDMALSNRDFLHAIRNFRPRGF